MMIIIKDFYYKGHYIESYGFEFPQLKNLDEVPEGRIEEYINESLDNFIKEEG